MLSERRRAQSGLMLACLMMFSTLAILFNGSRNPSRVGQAPVTASGVRVVMEGTSNVRLASLGK